MSDMQDVWLSEYLQCLNATEAARRAGYKWPNKKGPELKQQFADEIQAILKERIPSPEAVVSRVADIAMADLTEFIDENGRFDVQAMKKSGKGYLLKKHKIKDGALEVELYPADAAQDRLMRYHGLYSDKLDVKGKLIIDYVNDWRNPSDED
jgi:phage terminase small subunit